MHAGVFIIDSCFNTPGQYGYDIGVAAQERHRLKPAQMLSFLSHPKKPHANYEYPTVVQGKQGRKFQHKWLERFKWLAYSVKRNGAFCVHCVLFAPNNESANDLKMFVTTPMTKNKNALEDMTRHQSLSYHLFAQEKAAEFAKFHGSKECTSIDLMMDTHKKKTIEKNRSRLGPIVKTVLFCARNNLPLRGHRDSGNMSTKEKRTVSLNGSEGVFRALLAFRMDAGDDKLEAHLSTAPQNCTMISKTVQNEVIDIIGFTIRSQLLDRIKRAKFFAILSDETTDVSRHMQLSLCFRYVDEDTIVVREDFLGFVQLGSTVGLDVKNRIFDELRLMGLDIGNMRGQGYDGGSNFSGCENGVRALVSKEQPLAFYTHCFSHSLDLCVSKACEVPEIRHMLGTVSSIINFFTASFKRTQALEDEI